MAKYKVGDIFINHKDSKILQVCKGDCCKDCCYNKVHSNTCLEGVSCSSLIGLEAYFKELPSLPPGTKVKMREDLKEATKYGRQYFVEGMEHCGGVTIKQYNATLKVYSIIEDSYNYTLEMFDQVINEPKENNNMETKEIKINVPKGYEIDEENSTFECIKFKPIKKELTYKDVAEDLFSKNLFTSDIKGKIFWISSSGSKLDKNNTTNRKQLERLFALNLLLNIAEYYNKKSPKEEKKIHCINFDKRNLEYFIQDYTSSMVVRGLIPIFNNREDAKAVIDNQNFKDILDLVYKGDED